MNHSFENKLFVFIGTPVRCTRQVARDALFAIGGVLDDRISAFTHYVVAFKGSENTRAYSQAYFHDKNGHLILLSENRFFAVIEGIANPPEKQKTQRLEGFPYRLPENPKSRIKDYHEKEQEFIIKKRLMNMEKYGANVPEGTRLITDIWHLRDPQLVIEYLNNRGLLFRANTYYADRCTICKKPAMVHLSDSYTGKSTALCHSCYNNMMANLNDVDVPSTIPRRLSFKDADGKTCSFDIEFLIFETGKSLTATEVGEIKRKASVWSELDVDFDDMLEILTHRVNQTLSTKYMRPDGYFVNNKAEGYIEYVRDFDSYYVNIDGKRYSWSDLERSTSSYEGFKIKIEFVEMSEEFE